MEFVEAAIPGVFEVRFKIHGDNRGRFKRQFCRREFASRGLMTDVAQVNHSITIGAGSVRGLHYQLPPHAEDKLVTCTYGRVFDVAVDLRRGSPTYLQWCALELDETVAYYVPKGFAHGFQTLTDEAHIVYLHSEYYQPEVERGLRFDDPRLAIAWPRPPANMSARDLGFAPIGDDFAGVSL